MSAIDLANKMIYTYLNTGVEQYPEARAIDVLDTVPFGSVERLQAFNLFQAWLELRKESK